jgi:hypothetical protein
MVTMPPTRRRKGEGEENAVEERRRGRGEDGEKREGHKVGYKCCRLHP